LNFVGRSFVGGSMHKIHLTFLSCNGNNDCVSMATIGRSMLKGTF
jgi:hypothetical protein